MDDIVVSLGLKVLNCENSNMLSCRCPFCRETTIKCHQKKDFKGIVVNRAFPSLHSGSLKITLTVPLSKKSYLHKTRAEIEICFRNVFPGYREVLVAQQSNPLIGTCGTISWQVVEIDIR